MDVKDFEEKYVDGIAALSEDLYKAYCNRVYEPYNLDYPEWGYLLINTSNLFWNTARDLLIEQELPYWEED